MRSDSFDAFAADTGVQVRRALVAYYGVEVGAEAAADAMEVAWRRWDEVATMHNPAGFLFRVGQSRARPHVRWHRRRSGFPADAGWMSDDAAVVDLLAAMARLVPAQRACVLLVKSYGYSYRDAGELLGLAETAVTNHVHRGLTRLRTMMEVR